MKGRQAKAQKMQCNRGPPASAYNPGQYFSEIDLSRGAAGPRTPRSELSRFAPGPRAPNSQQKQHAGKQNHQKSNQEYKNNKPKGAGAKRPPPFFFVVFIIPDCFSDDFACRHVVFVVNLGPWALEQSDLTQSGGLGGGSPPVALKKNVF